MVTLFCPLTTTGTGVFVVQTGERRFVLHCKVSPVRLVGHARITFAPERKIVSGGGADDNVILNTVPLPEFPPEVVVPYRVLPKKINPAFGPAPSLLVPDEVGRKLYSVVKLVPSVLTANTVPLPELPP